MNLAIRGIEADLGQHNADTFFHDCHPTLKADFVLANPPFNLSDWGADKLADDVRWKYGTPPNGNATLRGFSTSSTICPDGRAGVVLANGSLSSQSGGEGDIRRRLVEADLVDCIVAMPPQLFSYDADSRLHLVLQQGQDAAGPYAHHRRAQPRRWSRASCAS